MKFCLKVRTLSDNCEPQYYLRLSQVEEKMCDPRKYHIQIRWPNRWHDIQLGESIIINLINFDGYANFMQIRNTHERSI